MKLIKINRRDFLDFYAIEKIVLKRGICYVYRNDGVYPKIIKSEHGIGFLYIGMINAGVTSEEIKDLQKRVTNV